MIASDKEIRRLLESGELEITNLKPESIQPASIDLRLGEDFYSLAPNRAISPREELEYEKHSFEDRRIGVKQFVLATTMERIKIPKNYAAMVQGRSSIGRLGLFVENAGWVDPGFEGELTLELYNATDVCVDLIVGMRICQLVLMKVGEEGSPYQGKYQGQMGPTGSRINLDPEVR